MSELDKKVIIALADNRMNITDAAGSLFIHRNTAIYHIEKVKQKTGLDARYFYDLCKLLEMVNGERKDNERKAD